MTVAATKGLGTLALVCSLAVMPGMVGSGVAKAHPRHHRHLSASSADPSAELAYDDSADSDGWHQSGTASWYGPGFTGRRTTMGTIFDPTEMTAAHTTLPMGTRLLVTERYSGRSIIVTVTDRLPPHRYRILDLSRGAASALGIVHSGLAQVTLRKLNPGDVPVEVAEAPDSAAPIDNPGLTAMPRVVRTARHDPRHRHHARP